MKKIFISLFFVSTLFVQGFAAKPYARMEFLVQSIPKGGTHLLKNALEDLRALGCPPRYRWAHFSQGQAYNAHRKIYPFLLENPDKKAIVLVRDMRDVLVSLMFYLDKAVAKSTMMKQSFVWFNVRPGSKEMEKWSELKNFDQKLDYLLSPESNFFAFSEKKCADDSYAIVNRATTLLVRFEDLVGDSGGGSNEKQLVTLEKIAQHICKNPPSRDKLSEVIGNSFGGKTFTEGGHFRRGQIGEWRKYFKPHHINKMQQIYNEYLLFYGYENDNNWSG